ncbi:MAG TPA: hypothetical protein VN687_14155 [Blastocatellia bacterium]|nr:hypothetical protein [Blastocatellia bacterium]
MWFERLRRPISQALGSFRSILKAAGTEIRPSYSSRTKKTLTGTYDGPLGQYNVTGTIKDNKAVFGFEFTNEDQKHKATYTATVESATRMTGTLEITDGPTGKWTATRK